MKKYLLLISLLPLFSIAQQCDSFITVIPANNANSINYCVTNTSCHDTCNGTISITVDGINGPYSYTWSIDGNTFLGGTIQDTLCPGDYIITITDVNGALVDNSHINTVEGPPNFSVFSDSLNNPSCFNDNDGSIYLTINGATPFDPDGIAESGDEYYTYLWEEGTATEDRSFLDSGIYILSMTDANGCNRIDSFELFNPLEVTSETITDTLSCIGLCDGNGIVTPNDGIAPYTFEWSDGQIDSIAINLCYGTNTVTITDANGCVATNTIDIANPDTLQLSNITIDSTCYQICDGQLSVTIQGGSSPYGTEWSFLGSIFNTSDTITNNDLCTGDYQLIFNDANNCSDTIIIPLFERDSFIVQDWIIDDSCYNSCTGQITVQLLNQESPSFIYDWSNGGNDTIISSLCSDTFSLIIIDDRLCRDTFEFFVGQGDSMYFDSLAVTNNSCYGYEDGAISLINFSGGTQPLAYLWSNGQTTSGINSLPTGSYIVTISDANGCIMDSSNIQVTQPDSLFITASSEHVSCFGGSNGLIDIDIFGGIEPYFISWDNQILDSTLIDTVIAGEYLYTLVDSNGCILSDTIIIEEPDSLMIQVSVLNVLCKGDSTGEINLTITGGTIPYEYSIDGGVTFQSQNYFGNLIANSYSIIVKDANDCILISPTYNITEPLTTLSAGLTTENLLCFSDTGSVILTVGGGTFNYSFIWSNGALTQNLYGVGSGNYSVDISDGNDCMLTKNTIITEPSEIISSPLPIITDLKCYQDETGSIDISIIGGTPGYTYAWDNGDTTSDINNLSIGTYEITVTDDNDCPYVASFIVEEPDLLAVSYNQTHVDCYGNSTGEIDVNVSGGTATYTYGWSNLSNDEDLLSIPSGNYNLSVTDLNNCSTLISVIINEPSDITYTMLLTDLICNNVDEGEISITASGGTPGYSYSIDGGASYQIGNDFMSLQADNYSVWIKDENECTKNQMAVINQPIGFSTTVDINNIVGCNGDATGSIILSTSGNTPPYSYNWIGNNQSSSSIYDLLSDDYEVVVSDANNCEMTYSYLITEPENIFIDYDIQLTSCEEKNDGSITTMLIGGTPPYYYLWGTGETTSDISNLSKGQYSLVVLDSKGCTTPIEYFDVSFDGFNNCVEIPSGFTPNNDNIHDEWIIYGLNDFPDVVVSIYNRWGQEIYSSQGYYNPWDGKYNGVDLPTAAYYYVIELNESDKVFNGTVTIKR